jgi:hypothetical protein
MVIPKLRVVARCPAKQSSDAEADLTRRRSPSGELVIKQERTST